MNTEPQLLGVMDDDRRVAPCLQDGPLSNVAREFIRVTRGLGDTTLASVLRVSCVPYLFRSMELDFATDESPIPLLTSRLTSLSDCLQRITDCGIAILGIPEVLPNRALTHKTTLAVTGEHYGQLFSAFSDDSYFREPTQLLRERLLRNGFDLSRFCGTKVLDAGCGGGRYTVAWRLLGAAIATGIDTSEIGITDARRRAQQAEIDGVTF